MRAALIALSMVLAVAVLAATSGADTPARARAQATVVSGSLGEFGTLEARVVEKRRSETVDVSGVKIGAAKTVARASRSATATARASSLAREIDLLDGLVTATAARRTAVAAGGKTVHSGRVAGLTLEGRRVGDVTKNRAYLLSDASSVAVNRGRTALTLILGSAHGSLPKGTKIRVATATAVAEDAVVATPTATPTATATATPKPEKKTPKRKRAPKIPKRLTGQGYTFPVYGKATAADDFGAARADTGVHEGNDVFAPFGAPVLAVADGTVHRVGTLPISGNRLWLHTDAGDAFFSPTSPPSPPTPRTAVASRPAPSSASPATPATPSRPAPCPLRDPPRRRGRGRDRSACDPARMAGAPRRGPGRLAHAPRRRHRAAARRPRRSPRLHRR